MNHKHVRPINNASPKTESPRLAAQDSQKTSLIGTLVLIYAGLKLDPDKK